MKKKHWRIGFTCILALFLCMSVFMAACQKNEEKGTEPDTTAAESTEAVEKTDEYASLAGVYTAKIYMTETQSIDLYLMISEDGTFVFARDTDFSSDEKGAGTLGKTEKSEDAFFYTVINGQKVGKDERIAVYEADKDGNIQFLSPMWFGSTEPKILDDKDTVTYPKFEKYDASKTQPAQTTDTEPSVETAESVSTDSPETSRVPETTSAPPVVTQPPETTSAAPETTSAPPETTQPPKTDPVPSLKEGTYTGTLNKFVDAMNSNVKYDVTITFRGGNYDFTVKVTLTGGMDYATEEHYNGTYTVNGDKLSMSGKLSSGTVKGTSVTLTGYFSSFAGSQDTLTVFQ